MSLDSPVFYFGTERISPLYKKILDHIGNVQFFYTGEYDSKEAVESLPKVHISSAPSRIRELESVHTKVCELLKDGANLSEILVVIPGLDDYRTAIHQVFDIPKRDNNVHIPYSIVDTDENSSFTRDFRVKFFSIARNQDFTRKDFFEIVNNPVVRAARGITAADVESFEHWTDKMSIFRNGDNREDWNRAVERMLLARLSSQKVESIVPFEDMDSKSDAVLSKFIRCIDDLQAWVEMSGRGEIVHKDETLESLKDIVRSWIQIKLAPAELAGEQASYIGTIGSFKGLEAEKSAGAATISFDIISKTLLRGANASDYSPAELFVGGLSIMKFNPSRVIPAKYTFILGMDSRTMPGRDEKNTLDLREDKEGLVTPRSEENRRAFYTTLANTEGKIFYSFVDKDLTKDEEFFESAYLTDFGCRTEKLGIDETRSWKEIFTSRENRNKKRFEGLFGSGTDNESSQLEMINRLKDSLEAPKVVSIANLRSFLTEPFSFQIGRMLLKKDENNAQNETLEPITFDYLQKWQYLHEIVENDYTKEEFISTHQDDTFIPSGDFGARSVDELISSKESIKAAMAADGIIISKSSEQDDESTRNTLITNGTVHLLFDKWTLNSKLSWHSEDGLSFVDVSNSEPKLHTYLRIYLSALSYWAEKDERSDLVIKLKMYCGSKSYEKNIVLSGSDEAGTILNQVYEMAYLSRYARVFPLDIISDVHTYGEYTDKFSDNYNPWMYFDRKDLFNVKEVCGFTESNFAEEWEAESMKMTDIVRFLEINTKDENNEQQ